MSLTRWAGLSAAEMGAASADPCLSLRSGYGNLSAIRHSGGRTAVHAVRIGTEAIHGCTRITGVWRAIGSGDSFNPALPGAPASSSAWHWHAAPCASPAEALAAATINAAAAIGLERFIGSIDPANSGSVDPERGDYRHLAYRFGGNLARAVMKKDNCAASMRDQAHADPRASNWYRK